MTKVPPTSPSPWFVPLRTRGNARVRLICFPSAGAGASAYGRWGSQLPADVDLWGIQLPGHETRLREPLMSDLEAAADQIAEQMSAFAEIPLVLFGHSMGALIAFETARRLRAAGMEPAALVVSARIAAHLIEIRESYDMLGEEEFLEVIGQRYGGVALLKEDAELRELYLPPLRADVTAVARYRCRPERPLDCPIHAIAGSRDATTPRAELEAWSQHTTGRFSMQVFPGDHFFINTERTAVIEMIVRQLTFAGRVEREGIVR